MKKKILSVLLCLCMVMALLPTTALAASGAPSTIYICGMPLTNGDCLTDNDATHPLLPIQTATLTLRCIRMAFCI